MYKLLKCTALLAATFILAGCVDRDIESERTASAHLDGTFVAGNPSCASLGLADYEFKVESENDPSDLFDGFNSITFDYINTADGQVVDFTSTLGIDAVIVKGGPNALVYEFDPETFGESGLSTPVNPGSGLYYDISHVSFCYDYELTVDKTAETTFTRTWDWDITKSVNIALHELQPGDVAASTYQVVVTNNGFVDSDFAASGTVTVVNNTPFDAYPDTIVDTLSTGVQVALNCDRALPTVLLPGEAITCSWATSLADDTALVNHVVVTTNGGTVDGDEASADIDFADALIDPVNASVQVEDDFEGNVTSLGLVSGTQVFAYSRNFTCDDAGENNNTATIVETGENDSALVEVVCVEVFEGCTPGYWKNHENAWTKYTTSQLVVDVFVEAAAYVAATDTLLDALDYKGGRTVDAAAQTLLRASTAALLDASHGSVNYPISVADVIARTNAALATGDRALILAEKDALDAMNNLGCPL